MNGGRAIEGIGPYVRRLREERGWTQTELEHRTGIDRARIAQIEAGLTKMPGVETRRRFCEAFHVSMLDFFIAAGQLSPDEIQAAGKVGVTPPDPVRAHLKALIDAINLTHDRSVVLDAILTGMKSVDRERVESANHFVGAGSPLR